MIIGKTGLILSFLGVVAHALDLPASQDAIEGFNLFDHLQGTGPFTQLYYSVSTDVSVPEGCEIEKVFMACRHGERYPVAAELDIFEASLWTMKHLMPLLHGKMEFIKNYTLYMTSEEADAETTTGPYSGTQFGLDLGSTFYKRYSSLLTDSTLNIYSSSSSRVVATAENFANGFFSGDDSKYNLVVLSEDAKNGANSLTPDSSCLNLGIVTTVLQEAFYTSSMILPIVTRLAVDYGAIGVGAIDVFVMSQLCALELNALGDSQFCDIFTEDEWEKLGYQADVALYDSYGPGSTISRAAGSVYLNNTLTLMNQNTSQQLYFSFMHDVQIQTILSAFNIPEQPSSMASNYGDEESTGYFSSQFTPMGAHFVLEVLKSGAYRYVRALLDESVVAIPGCTSGPGFSCPYEDFVDFARSRWTNFVSSCDVPSSEPQYSTFYWDNKSTA